MVLVLEDEFFDVIPKAFVPGQVLATFFQE